jgi:Autotransporter beta-domain
MKLIISLCAAVAALFITVSIYGQTQLTMPDLTPNPLSKVEGSVETLAENGAKWQAVSTKFIRQTGAKAVKYARRIQSKTEKTLQKLARWEGKIRALLEKASPETAQRLFGNPQYTFAGMLEQYYSGWWGHQPGRQQMANGYGKTYDEYRDRLGNTMAYLSAQNTKAKGAGKQLQKLDSLVDNTEALQQSIKERKRQLIEQSIQYIGKRKWLQKIDRDSYYFFETLRNYKDIFQDEKKAEELAMRLLRRMPNFESFLQRNSAVAGLFGFGRTVGTPAGAGGAAPNLAGLQTRASVTALIQNQLGANAQPVLTQNVQQAQAQLNQLKDRVGDGAWDTHHGGDGELPNFKPNITKTKTFLQRIEYTANVGFAKLNPLAPGGNTNATADIALGIGYKLNDKSTIGVGAGYKLGMGSLQRIRISGQGIGLRSYIDWKLKKQFYVSGGYEMNWLAGAEAVRPVGTPAVGGTRAVAWQPSGLIGIAKKMKLRTKWFRASNIQLLYDFLHTRQMPVGQAFVFRVGYSFR